MQPHPPSGQPRAVHRGMAPGLCCGGGEIFRESSTQSRVKRPRMAFLGDTAHGCALSPTRPLPHPSPAFPEKSPDGAAQPESHPPMHGPPFPQPLPCRILPLLSQKIPPTEPHSPGVIPRCTARPFRRPTPANPKPLRQSCHPKKPQRAHPILSILRVCPPGSMAPA